MLGKDITLEDFVSENTFFNGFSRAAHLTKSLVRSLVGIEALRQKVPWHEHEFDPMTVIPFRDLWCSIRHRRRRAAIRLLRAWLAIVRPLIVDTNGRETVGVTRSHFQHDLSEGIIGSLMDEVGVPKIHYYGEDHSDTSDCAFIAFQ